MLVQITLEILFPNEQSTAPSILIITPSIYSSLFKSTEASERMVSGSFREVSELFSMSCSGQHVRIGQLSKSL